MKKGFFIFNKGSKNKSNFNVENSDFNTFSDSNDSEELVSGLDSFVNFKKNYETAADAISIRSSVDCSNHSAFKQMMSKYFQKPKSFKRSEMSLSYQNLNFLKEKRNERQNKSRRSFLFNQNSKFPYEDAKCNYDYSNSIPEDGCSFIIPQNPIKKTLKKISPLREGITTAAILGRHESLSSNHSNIPWIETEQGKKAFSLLSKEERNRQNAIHELLTGEETALKDLMNVVRHYKEPMETLKLINQVESFNIFYTIEQLIPIYDNILKMLKSQIDENGIVACIGRSLLYSCDMLEPVLKYCIHLYYSKCILEEKRKTKEVGEFLQACSSCKFSRKLDVWDFLDNPRSRLMKYPLLIDRIFKSTDINSSDYQDLLSAKKVCERMLTTLDERTGEEMCNFYLDKIEFPEENQYVKLVKEQKVLLFEGRVKVGRSLNLQKVHAFLFEKVLIFTKQILDETVDRIRYVVCGNPLPTSRLVLEDIKDDEIKMGSFRSTFISDRGSKNVFRLTLLSDFIPESEFVEGKIELNNGYSSDELSSNTDKYDNSQECRMLKNSQTIIQVAKCEEKQLWLSILRKVVAREIKKT